MSTIDKIKYGDTVYDINTDTLPVGSIIEYEGDTVPDGFEEVKENVLFDGKDNGTVTLNDNINNYSYVEVFCSNGDDDLSDSIKFIPGVTTGISVKMGAVGGDGKQYEILGKYRTHDNIIELVNSKQIVNGVPISTSNVSYIRRVIGYK